MEPIEIDAGTLLFSEEDLTATGLLVPYGVECRSSIGRFTVDRGAFTIPTDTTGMSLNREHAREYPVAAFSALKETDAGIQASFKFQNTPEGRQAFADAKSGERKHLSVEARNVIVKAGKAVGGVVFGGGLVKAPAFAGATLLAAEDTVTVDGQEVPAHTETTDAYSTTATDGSQNATESDTTEDITVADDGTVTVVRTTTTTTTRTPPAQTTDTTTPTESTTTGDTMGGIPATLTASQGGQDTTTPAANGMNLRELNTLLAAAHNGDSGAQRALREQGEEGAVLYGALSDIAGTGTPASGAVAAIAQPQWVGEAYSRATYERRYIPLFAHADLTGFSINGFKWTTPPVMGEWTGNKTDVPSAKVRIDPTSADAKGFAGAHDIDRRVRDFGFPEFWDGYWRHMSNSYNKLSDADALATVLAGATPVVAGAVPANVSRAAVAIVDGYLAVQEEGVPTFAILAPDLWREFILTPREHVLEYLSVSLNLEDGQVNNFRILPGRTVDIDAGSTLVGIGQAATVYELPGSPIRVEGLDMVRGGIDPGAFGYEVTDVEDAAAFAHVTFAP